MSLEWLLFAAIQRGAVGDVKSILDTEQANVNARDESGWTPLTRAAANDDAETVAVLLAARADPYLAARSGLTAWGLAGENTRAVLLAAMTVRDDRDARGVLRLDPRHPALPAGWTLERVSRGQKRRPAGRGEVSDLPCGSCGSRPTFAAAAADGDQAAGRVSVRCSVCAAVSEFRVAAAQREPPAG